MKTDKVLSIVKGCLVNEWQHLPAPLESDRVLEMINTALKDAKSEIDRISSLDEKK